MEIVVLGRVNRFVMGLIGLIVSFVNEFIINPVFILHFLIRAVKLLTRVVILSFIIKPNFIINLDFIVSFNYLSCYLKAFINLILNYLSIPQ